MAVVVSSANMELALVRQCVDRALVLDDRVSKFSVQLGEWPGDMAKLLDFLSREDVRYQHPHRRLLQRASAQVESVSCSSSCNLAAPCRPQTFGRLPSDTKRQVRPLQVEGRRLISPLLFIPFLFPPKAAHVLSFWCLGTADFVLAGHNVNLRRTET